MALITRAPRGTFDKLPAETRKYQFVENAAKEVADVYGFKEIRTPVFEHTELFQRSVGLVTDIVQKEMYTFEDKKGRSLTLKPEGTAGALRAAIENGLLNEAAPLKLYYLTNCYRYEAPQSGRYREFTQFGVEMLGASTPTNDAELLALAADIFDKLGIPANNYTIEINSIGCPDCRANYRNALKEYYSQFKYALCPDCLERLERAPMRLLDCKTPSCAEFKDKAPTILRFNCGECIAHFDKMRKLLASLEVPYLVNPKIARGLDYYSNTVFEFICKENGLVFGGGGRYNGLLSELDDTDYTKNGYFGGAGFALGIERLISVMELAQAANSANSETAANSESLENGLFPAVKLPDLYIASMGEKAEEKAAVIAKALRRVNLRVERDLAKRSLKAQMRYADKIGAKFSMVLGDDELESGRATVRNMASKETEEIDFTNIENLIKCVWD